MFWEKERGKSTPEEKSPPGNQKKKIDIMKQKKKEDTGISRIRNSPALYTRESLKKGKSGRKSVSGIQAGTDLVVVFSSSIAAASSSVSSPPMTAEEKGPAERFSAAEKEKKKAKGEKKGRERLEGAGSRRLPSLRQTPPLPAPSAGGAGKKKRTGVLLQSAALPYLWTDDGELRVMLVTASGGGPWIVPKGNIAKNMTPWDSAAKEAFEEAGVIGVCEETEVGEYLFSKNGSRGTEIRVKVYPMELTGILPEWEESGLRKRRLFLLSSAARVVREPGLSVLLKEFRPPKREGENAAGAVPDPPAVSADLPDPVLLFAGEGKRKEKTEEKKEKEKGHHPDSGRKKGEKEKKKKGSGGKKGKKGEVKSYGA